jgi:hypothetical protein
VLLKYCNERWHEAFDACFVPGLKGSKYADDDPMIPMDCTLAERVLDLRAPEPSACRSLRGV